MTVLPFSAVVLAGGRSSRMGKDKASLPFGRQTLLDRQLELVRNAGATEVLVSMASGTASAPASADVVVVDRVADAGPLAGLEAALVRARFPRLLVVAVDLPAMTSDYLRRLVDRAAEGTGVVPVRDGRYEPLAALYPRRVLDMVRRRLDAGDLRLQAFVRESVGCGMVVECVVAPDEEPLFANWNHPSDLLTPTDGGKSRMGPPPGP